MTARLPAAPKPGETFTVADNGLPSEQQVTDTAIDNGWMIAWALVAVAAGTLLAWLWRSPVTRILLAAAGAGTVVYFVKR